MHKHAAHSCCMLVLALRAAVPCRVLVLHTCSCSVLRSSLSQAFSSGLGGRPEVRTWLSQIRLLVADHPQTERVKSYHQLAV